MADIQPITAKADYDAALARVSELMYARTGPEGQIEDANHPARVELDALVDLIEKYESEHYPIEHPDAVTAT
ncbi:MAG: transcriptional regulator [Chloroflexi bacterium]|nr:transcriptional regulator [Chloroflexota bacterium]